MLNEAELMRGCGCGCDDVDAMAEDQEGKISYISFVFASLPTTERWQVRCWCGGKNYSSNHETEKDLRGPQTLTVSSYTVWTSSRWLTTNISEVVRCCQDDGCTQGGRAWSCGATKRAKLPVGRRGGTFGATRGAWLGVLLLMFRCRSTG